MSIFWELHQHQMIGEARSAASSASVKAENTKELVAALEGRVEKLQLACQAMWELLRQQSGLTDEQLMQRMQEVDLRDGKADGKMGHQGQRCTQCQRPLAARHARCLYCGAEMTKPHAFQL